MKVNPTEISPAAARKEQELESDFFKLLYITEKKQAFSSCSISPPEWCIAADCLDQINYRYADIYALCAFVISCPMCARPGRSLIARLRWPLYLTLVGYDCGLRTISPFPAVTYWNSVCMLNSDMGDIARTLNTPDHFYEVEAKDSRTYSQMAASSYVNWLTDSALFVTESLFLKRLLAYVLEGSCWKEKLGENSEVSSLVVNSRFFKWRLLDARLTYEKERVIYEINTSLFPTFGFQRSMRRSYRCRRLIMERSSTGGRLWYGANFALMRLFGVERN